MDKRENNQIAEANLLLKWGSRKRLRCVRVRDPQVSYPSSSSYGDRIRRETISHFLPFTEKEISFFQSSTRLTRNSEAATLRFESRKLSASPEKEETGNDTLPVENGGGAVWPKLYITLSSKEKEEDFMAMKGCKLPHRPKKRAKMVQRTVLLVSPGAWLTDMCHERYEVREKKSTKKKPRGLKAMGKVDSDSE